MLCPTATRGRRRGPEARATNVLTESPRPPHAGDMLYPYAALGAVRGRVGA